MHQLISPESMGKSQKFWAKAAIRVAPAGRGCSLQSENPIGGDLAAPAQIPAFEQVLFLGFEREVAVTLLRDMGRGQEAMIFVNGTDWQDTSWAVDRATGSALALVRYSPESFENIRQFCQCVATVSVAFRPSRLAVFVPDVTTRTNAEIIKAGANHVLPLRAGRSQLAIELRDGGIIAAEMFGDAAPWLETLERVAEKLYIDEDPRARLKSILLLFTRRLGVDRSSIALVENNSMEIAAVTGQTGNLQEGQRLEVLPESVTARVIESRRARLIQGAAGRASSSVRSAICAPLLARNEVLGVVSFSSMAGGRQLGENDLRAAELFAGLLALSLSNRDLLESMLSMRALSTVGAAMASVSHSLKNLLLVLGGGSSLVDAALKRGDLESAREAMGILKNGVHRTENLVLDLLSYSKSREPSLAPTNVRELADELAQSFSRARANNTRTLTVEVDVSRDSYMLDGNALERALLNLLINAIEATPEKGAVLFRIRESDGELAFSVSDNGSGVEPEKIESIFTPFFSTKGSKGTGLGLSTVRKFAEENDGDAIADICPELGGLCVTIRLPIRKAKD